MLSYYSTRDVAVSRHPTEISEGDHMAPPHPHFQLAMAPIRALAITLLCHLINKILFLLYHYTKPCRNL